MREKGLTLKSTHGDAQLKVAVLEEPAQTAPVDVVIFAVKLWDTEGAAERLRPIIGRHTAVIPFQNGVESVERLQKVLPKEAVMGGSAYIATRIAAPGVIEHIGQMARLQFGPVLPAQRPAAAAFLAACQAARIDAAVPDDVVRAIWEKFVFLVAVSSATAVSRAPLGVVRADPDLRRLFESALRETWALGRARGVPLADDLVEDRLKYLDTMPHEMKASMAHDLEAGGRLEAPWLCGAVARMSAEAGLEAPVNRAVFAALKPFLNGSPAQAS